MGFVSGLLGTAGGVNGTGISGPNNTNILNPATTGQAQEQYSIANVGLGQQSNLLNALQQQNGLQNQSNVFNQLQGVANGTGPNPALAQLNQATGANTANQAALMAGQRGSGANAGLIARQAAMQGAANQQQAAGQGATLQAQQQLNAMNQLGGIAGQQAQQLQQGANSFSQAAQGEQQNVLNAIGQQNNANVGMQSNINSANANLAGETMKGQNNLLGNVVGGVGSALGLAEGGTVPKMANGGFTPVSVYYNNTDNVFPSNMNSMGATPYSPMSAPMPSIPAPIATPVPVQAPPGARSSAGKFFKGFNSIPSTQQPQLTGTALSGNTIGKGIGAGINALFGSSKPVDSKSSIPTENQYAALYGAPGTRQQNGMPTENAMYEMMSAPQGNRGPQASPEPIEISQPSDVENPFDPAMAQGGRVPAMVSPGEQYIPPKELKKVKKGEKDPLEAGERIPGKPKFPGNDYRNDTVKKDLKEGGLVIPNSVMQSKNPHWEAMKFVHAHTRSLKKGK